MLVTWYDNKQTITLIYYLCHKKTTTLTYIVYSYSYHFQVSWNSLYTIFSILHACTIVKSVIFGILGAYITLTLTQSIVSLSVTSVISMLFTDTRVTSYSWFLNIGDRKSTR